MDDNPFPNIDELIQYAGEVTLGRIGSAPCAGTAADRDTTYAILVRDDDESLMEFLRRLDTSIRLAIETETMIDEINP